MIARHALCNRSSHVVTYGLDRWSHSTELGLLLARFYTLFQINLIMCTDNLIFREFKLDDAQFIADEWSDSVIMPTCTFPNDAETVKAIIEEWGTHICNGRNYEVYAVTLKGRIVGLATIYSEPGAEADIGVVIDSRFRERGYGYKSVQFLEKRAKQQGCILTNARCGCFNFAAIELLKKCKYTEVRSHEVCTKQWRKMSMTISFDPFGEDIFSL